MEESRGGDTPIRESADAQKENKPGGPEHREKWANKTEFLLSMAGEIIGLGNVWRFPYLCYKNGGGVFFIPYFVFLVFCGIPIFFLETSLGQYTSEGGITAWKKICPMFEGVGIASQVIVIYLNIYYIVVLAWALFYLFNCFRNPLPWTTCDNVWNTARCHTFNQSMLASGLHRPDADWSFLYNETNIYDNDIFSSNSSSSETLPYEIVSPEEEFWLNRMLRITIDDSLGPPHYDLVLCLLLAWVICYFCIWKGVKSTGKVVYFTATFPYLMLLILFFRGVTLPGAGAGITYYLYPDISKLTNPDVSFRFQAQELDLMESFWTFLIPEHNLSVPFLLVGTANEPVVYIDHAHLNLGSLLIGQETCKTVNVVNGEDRPFSFSIEEVSRHSEALRDSLLLEPMEGTIPPKEKVPLVISFTPTQEGSVVFNLLIAVRGKIQPLTLNVKAEGYSMNACVQYEGPEGAVTELSPTNVHLVDFKMVELSDTSTCAFVVSNPGKFSLDVQYELTGLAELQRHLQVEPRTAMVPVGGQDRCILSFFPLQKCVLKDMRFSVKVKNGPTFCCSLLGSATAPSLEFSFLKYNFGMNFIYSAGMVPATHTLLISNKGERGISMSCLFSNTPSLEVSFTPEVLPPGGSMKVLFTFYPREAARYHENVVFEINECAKQVVEILGQGIKMKIDVEDPKHKVVKLGALQVGQKSKKLIPLINNSDSSLTFSLLFTPSAHALFDSRVLSLRPEQEVTLPGGGGRCVVEVVFTPCQRMAPFSEELQLKCLGTVCPLLVLKGCCQGVEVTLDQDYLPFGAVSQRCQATRRVILQNTGDIGARFQWDVKSFAPDFSICPAEGYIFPGMEVPLEVIFAPVEVRQNVRYDHLCCSIEGGKPVNLTLAGSCIAPPVANQVVNFVCQVRSECTQSLSLSNPSNHRWSLKPVLEGEYWSASPSFVVEPYQQNKAYEITYKPMVMTTDGKKHLGSIFFSFPDGSGMLYTLQGTAEPPKAVAIISREIPCKTPYTEMVPVQNWLSKPQRFRAIVEMGKPERTDSTVSLKGLDYVDVPALAKRDYKISFFSYKEGQYNAKVTFKNEATGEYLFYNLSFKATPPGVISTIEMVAAVRQTTSACVEVDNPLPTNLVFSVECRSVDISVQSQFPVLALSKDTLKLQYQPLRTGESTTRLSLQNSELGSFHYELVLRALPTPPEKPLYFKAPLGSGHYLTAKFTNYSRVKTEYACKTDCPDFIVEKTITAAAGFQTGSDVTAEVYFEPSQLGEVRGLLTISSSSGGDYVFPLYGTCTPPKAQGPLTVRAGSNVSISFKNVFPQATAFSFQVDNPAFTVKGVDTIRSKKSHNVLVSFEGPPAGSKAPCTGKLTISSPRTEGHGQSLSWVYYLKGICPEQPQREKTS